jgi:multidrug resistance efflux pump
MPADAFTAMSEVSRTLAARPPRVVRATWLVLVAMLGAAAAWAWFSKIELVVQAPGRVRPAVGPARPLAEDGGTPVVSAVAGRVSDVLVAEGDAVAAGAPLARLDAQRIDNEIARLERQVEGAAAEAERLDRMAVSLDEERAGAVAKAKAEIAEADGAVRAERDRVRVEEERRAADERVVAAEVEKQRTEVERVRGLVKLEVAPRIDLVRAEDAWRDAEKRLERARVRGTDAPAAVAEERAKTARAALELIERQFAVRRQELELRAAAQKSASEADRRTLANLRLERDHGVVRATESGVVTRVRVRAGDVVQGGQPVASVAAGQGLRVDAAVRTGDAGLLRTGLKARIKLDAYDHQKYGTLVGTVTVIAPDATVVDGGACYLVQVSLDETPLDRGARARLGLAAQVEIVTEEERVLLLAFRRFKDKISIR